MNKNFILKSTILSLCITLMGCGTITEYYNNIVSDPRESKIVYKTGVDYDETQFDLEVPPDLITPSTPSAVSIPELAKQEGMELFTVDTKLDSIELLRSGKDAYLSINKTDKEKLWSKLIAFWRDEGFRVLQNNIALGTMRTDYVENLSEAQLGTLQRIVGRYLPLLVEPETRDSYKTRIVEKANSTEIIITHYGKEFTTDGDTEYRWQNRPRDPEFEMEMTSRLFIYLGGEEAKSKGYVVVKATGVRGKAFLSTDENGMYSLFVPDIYERVWPQLIKTVDQLGVKVVSSNQSEGEIKISLTEQEKQEKSFLDKIVFWGKDDAEVYMLMVKPDIEGTMIVIEDESYVQVSTQAAEEMMRGLYSGLR
ncbi:MAG: hypothetical protein CMD88_03685 [Gammaproteobacteria bacterium]|nr:hypothetical protein [Gammaproteobacteria bacterium]|tara:strand:+ start:203432 stop:204529 length:1098 start_codon:yes stop_codon:yes gene_type:complete